MSDCKKCFNEKEINVNYFEGLEQIKKTKTIKCDCQKKGR